MATSSDSCATCIFIRTAADGVTFQCRYNVPDASNVSVSPAQAQQIYWPAVLPTDWCGNFTPAPAIPGSCATCFFTRTAADGVSLECHYNVPSANLRPIQVSQTSLTRQSSWPQVLPTDFCARFSLTSANKGGWTSFGNYSSINYVTYAPGDPVNSQTFTNSLLELCINNYTTGDLSVYNGGRVADQIIFTSYKHTGVLSAAANVLDVEPTINSDSTGPWSQFAGALFMPVNYGSGSLVNLVGVQGFTQMSAGIVNHVRSVEGISGIDGATALDIRSVSGEMNLNWFRGNTTITRAANIYAQLPTFGGGGGHSLSLSLYAGIWIEDMSVVPASSAPMNLISKGVNSLNVFEGAVTVGSRLQTMATTVTLLGPAGAAGNRSFVTDSTGSGGSVGTIVSGGGTNAVPVYSDGVNWRIG